jgi:SAM-dependent methyltransferase
MTAAHGGYVHASTPFETELTRLRLLEGRYDDLTARRLRVAGDLTGARCLEVGAGAGSVTRMLAAAVGPSGEVVATDLDPRFLAEVPENVTVRRHDILTDDLEPDGFDLVHCRALLLHLPDPARALRRMAEALCPGGWLLVEDADYSSFAATPGHPAAEVFDRVARAVHNEYLSDRMDILFGARLPGLVDELGLQARGGEALGFRRDGGSPEAEMFRISWIAARDSAIAAGVCSAEELDTMIAAFADPTFSFQDSLSVAAWGRRPAPPYFG